MLTLDLDEFMFELKDGALKHVGTSNKSATAKLYDVEAVDAREFGDERVKLTFEDGEGNEIQVAVDPPEAKSLAQTLGSLEEASDVFE